MTIMVLLVEDHTMTRMGLQLALEKVEDIEIAGEADNGEKAVRMAKELNPDVILMDIGLPGIDGIEATQKIKDAKLDSNILIFTSRDSEDDVFAAFGAGANAYIMKGAGPEQLTSAIRAVSEGAAWIDPAIAKVVLKSISQPRKTPAQNPGGQQTSSHNAAMAAGLTQREIEVLKLIVEGMSNATIAETLFITRATAKAHVHSILQKLCVDDRTQAAVTAMKEGLV